MNIDIELIVDGGGNGTRDGQIPVWAQAQLQQALDQLFRTNMIR